MARTDVLFVADLDEKGVISKAQNLERGLENLGKTTERTDSVFKRLTQSFVAANIVYDLVRRAARAFTDQLKDTITQAIEADKVDRALEATLAIVGETSGVAADKLKAYASALQRKTIYDDEAIKSAQTLIIQMRGTTAGIEQATRGAIGLASVFRMDLQTAARYTAMALEGNYRMLGQMIPAIREAKTETEKHEMATKFMADAYLRAEADAGTFYGRLENLKNTYNDLKQTIGEWVTKNEDVVATLGGIKEILIWLDRWVSTQKDKPSIAKWWNWTAPGALMLSLRKLGDTAKESNEKASAWPGLLADMTRAAEDATAGLDEVAIKLNLVTEMRYQAWLKSQKMLELPLLEMDPGKLFPEGGTIEMPPFLQNLIDAANEGQKKFKSMEKTWHTTITRMDYYSDQFFDNVTTGFTNAFMNFRLSTEGFRDFFIATWNSIKRAFFQIIGEMLARWAVMSFVKMLFPLQTLVPSFVGGILPGGPILAQHGYSGVVTQPTMFIAGESAPERVNIQPIGHAGGGGDRPVSITFNIHAIDASGIEKFLRHDAYPTLRAMFAHGDL